MERLTSNKTSTPCLFSVSDVTYELLKSLRYTVNMHFPQVSKLRIKKPWILFPTQHFCPSCFHITVLLLACAHYLHALVSICLPFTFKVTLTSYCLREGTVRALKNHALCQWMQWSLSEKVHTVTQEMTLMTSVNGWMNRRGLKVKVRCRSATRCVYWPIKTWKSCMKNNTYGYEVHMDIAYLSSLALETAPLSADVTSAHYQMIYSSVVRDAWSKLC